MKKTTIFILFLVLVVAGTFLSGCTTGKVASTAGDEDKRPVTQQQALAQMPDFTTTTITGETVSSESYLSSGKPTLVYFMASWCPTCAKNWPSLNTVYTEYNDKANIVAISIDPTDTQDVLTKLATDKNLIFPIVPGNPQIMIDFGVKGQATTVGVDADGNIQFIKSGEFSVEEYGSMIESLI
jgi:peroxiredoxin